MLDQAYSDPSAGTTFASDLSSDITYLNAQTSAWPTAYHTKYPSDSNWQILQAIYPNAVTDIFDYEFMVFDNQSTVSDLNTVLYNYLPNTKAFVSGCLSTQMAAVGGQIQPRAGTGCTVKVTNANGINCNEHKGGRYPEDGHFFDCSTKGTYGATALAELKALFGKYPDVLLRLSARAMPVEFYVFDDAVQFGTYNNLTNPQTSYNTYAGLAGVTTLPIQNPNGFQASIVWGYEGTAGNYPNTSPVLNILNSMVHEAGHSYDFVASGTYPSYSAELARVAAIDNAFMNAQVPGNTFASTDSYWLQYNSGHGTTAPDKHWAELFAEWFAISVAGNVQPVDTVLSPYWLCSKVFTQTWMSENRAPTTADYHAANLDRCAAP